MKLIKFFTLLALALSLASCNFSANHPTINTSSTQLFEVNEAPFANAEVTPVNIEMGAGTLKLAGGSDKLLQGTVAYTLDSWKPEILRKDNILSLKQHAKSDISIPTEKYTNTWDLKLGSMPVELSVTAGAYEGNLELGGLAITRLSISDGASGSTVSFNKPNPAVMSAFIYKTGASTIKLQGLGNANMEQLNFTGGVGNFLFDFSGDNARDVNVNISSGMSDITIIIPANVRSEVIVGGDMNDTNIKGTWTVEDNVYQSGTTGALIKIHVSTSLGSLNLIQE